MYTDDQIPISSAPHHLTKQISSVEVLQSPCSKIMINPKRVIQLARKWQKMATMRSRRISFLRNGVAQTSSAASKGHFVVYNTDNLRFTVTLKYLGRSAFVELLRMSEEEFGLQSDGHITLPCTSTFLNYVISLVKGCLAEDLEKA